MFVGVHMWQNVFSFKVCNMKSFLLMLQFMTRIPIPFVIPCESEDFAKGPPWFPAVGWVIGGILFAAALLLNRLETPWMTAALLVALEVLLTGGLHLDGLADSFDGLYSNRDRERILEIMKDSRIGSNGVLALIGLLGLKVITFACIPAVLLPMAVLVMPVAARFNMALASYLYRPARPQGMGNLFIGQVTPIGLVLAASIYLIPVLFIHPIPALAIGGTLMIGWGFARSANRILAGITGDILGALCEIGGLAFVVFYWLGGKLL